MRAQRIAVLCFVLALTATLAWRTEQSRDLGFHVQAGRYILEHHAWPQVDTFTWTLQGRPYIDMNGLFQVLLALASRAGMAGVGLLRVAFSVAAFAVLWLSARRRGVESPALLGVGFLLALLTWEVRLMARPELVSSLCLAALLYLLRRHDDSGDWRFLFAAVPLQLAWVYSHSLSMFGLAVLGLYALTRLREPLPWIALAAAVAVTFLNPYGWRGVQWQLSLGPRIAQGNPFADTQPELISPFSAAAKTMPALLFFKIMLALSAAAVLAASRRISRFDGCVVALFGVLASVHMRIVSMFAVAALPIALEAASGLGRRLQRPAFTAGALLAIAFVGQQTISGSLYDRNRYASRFGYAESPAVFPIGAVRTLEESGLQGRIFNAIEHGGYLELHLPQAKTFIDGRLEVMDEDFFVPYLRALEGGEGWTALEEKWHPTIALVPANDRGLVRQLLGEPGWALVDVDAVAFLFARETPGRFDAIQVQQERLRRQNAPAALDDEAIAPPPPRSWIASLFGPKQVPFEAFGRGTNFLQLGLFEAARRELRTALLEADDPPPPLIKAYAIATAELGRRDESRTWCRRLLEISPQDEDARTLLTRLDAHGS